MRITPTWWLGLVIVVAYTAWLSGWSMFFHYDYRTIAAPEHVLHALVVPLAIATALLCVFLWRCGWVRSVFFEPRKERQPLFLAILLVLMAGCVVLNVTAVHIADLDLRYLLVLAGAMLMVGFCEEVLTRGVLLVGLRRSCKSEVGVWFWSSLVFGSLHAINGLTGLGYMALLQVVFAFCAGTLFYLLRRLTGALLVPILLHAMWDFSTFIPAAGKVETPPTDTLLLMVTHLASLVIAVLFFRQPNRRLLQPA